MKYTDNNKSLRKLKIYWGRKKRRAETVIKVMNFQSVLSTELHLIQQKQVSRNFVNVLFNQLVHIKENLKKLFEMCLSMIVGSYRHIRTFQMKF